jgi:hypothetical protein
LINEPVSISDTDVRKLFTYLALMSEPNNVDVHFDMDNNGFSNRYSIYLQELQKVTLPDINSSPLINLRNQ